MDQQRCAPRVCGPNPDQAKLPCLASIWIHPRSRPVSWAHWQPPASPSSTLPPSSLEHLCHQGLVPVAMPPAAAIDALIRPLLWLALGLLHLLALVLALVPAFPPRRRRSSPSSSSSAAASASTKPPPRHVQLLLIAPSASARTSDARNAAVDRLLVESVARAVDWATAEGVTELSVFEPSGQS